MTEVFSNKQVLVTGAAGFIGSHLVDHLLEAGANVVGVDNFLTGRKDNLAHLKNNDNFVFIEADVIAEPQTYLPADQKIDFVFHFASPASPPRYQAHPQATYRVNAMATDLLLSFLHQQHPQAKFIFASTSEVYGDPHVHPQKEDYWGNVNPNGLRSCYDEGKRLGETICGVYQRDLNMDVRIVRIFNTYGERMDPTDGRVIPNFVMQALKGEKFTIYGDGSQTRSYCYVADLVKGILSLAGAANGNGQTVNLGNPEEYTVKETAELIYRAIHQGDAANFEDNITVKPLPQDDPLRRKPDISKAKELLNWQPAVSFHDGLAKTISYFQTLT